MVGSLIQIYGSICPSSQFTMKINTETPLISMAMTLYTDGIVPKFLHAKRAKNANPSTPRATTIRNAGGPIVRPLDGPTPWALAGPQKLLVSTHRIISNVHSATLLVHSETHQGCLVVDCI